MSVARVAITFIFVGCLGAALVVFLSLDRADPRQRLQRSGKEAARLVMTNFHARRYQALSMVASFKGGRAELYDPNLLKVTGSLEGKRYSEEGVEVLRAREGRGWFGTKKVSELMSAEEIERGELIGDVKGWVREHELRTDYAEYLAAEDTVQSTLPVRVDGPKRWFKGANGFVYGLEERVLTVPGDVEGLVYPEDASVQKGRTGAQNED